MTVSLMFPPMDSVCPLKRTLFRYSRYKLYQKFLNLVSRCEVPALLGVTGTAIDFNNENIVATALFSTPLMLYLLAVPPIPQVKMQASRKIWNRWKYRDSDSLEASKMSFECLSTTNFCSSIGLECLPLASTAQKASMNNRGVSRRTGAYGNQI